MHALLQCERAFHLSESRSSTRRRHNEGCAYLPTMAMTMTMCVNEMNAEDACMQAQCEEDGWKALIRVNETPSSFIQLNPFLFFLPHAADISLFFHSSLYLVLEDLRHFNLSFSLIASTHSSINSK